VIQNFCVKVGTDSRQETRICTRRRDGILTAEFYVREKGGILKSVSVIAHTRGDGFLEIEVWDPNNNLIFSHVTER
jgi:hypothetical protein